MKMNLKGEITSKTLVGLVLLLVGAVIIGVIISQLIWTGEVDKQVCHQSVILRATTPSIAQSVISLKCRTQKFCITSGLFGRKCDETFKNTPGVEKVKVSDNKQIEKFISGEVVDCWKTMGEGKVSLFSQFFAERYGFGEVQSSCVICSRIAFDEKLASDKKINLSQINVFDYMANHAIPNGEESYLQYIAGDSPVAQVSFSNVKVFESFERDGEGEPKKKVQNINSEIIIGLNQESSEEPVELQKAELAVLFMQVSAPGHGDSFLNIGQDLLGVGLTGAALIPGGGKLAVNAGKYISKICTNPKGVIVCGAIAAIAIGVQQGSVASNRGITAGYCGDLVVGNEARNGCSVVRVVNYDVSEIKKHCNIIESIA
jgi:hypothetical protein